MILKNLSSLQSVVKQYNLAAKKALGQNFLCDLNLTEKIVCQANISQEDEVIEIGPGPGGLTRSLLEKGAHVVAIELDQRCLPLLEELAKIYPGYLHIVHGNALTYDFSSLFFTKTKKPKIVSNLPYNIGTELLVSWLQQEVWPPFYESLTLMFQREVAERIVATPNSYAYGRLSVLCGWRANAHIAFNISPKAFIPSPKVLSSIVYLFPKMFPLPCSVKKLENITRAAFGQRRKMLRQSLKSLGGEKLLSNAGIDSKRRAETLSIEEFVNLANALET